MQERRAHPAKRVNRRRTRKTTRREKTRHGVYKNRQTRVHLVVKLGVFRLPGALLSFSRSFHNPKPLHLWYLNMSEASVRVLDGPRDVNVSNSTVNTASTVSRMIIV